jgi:hypothetical protein
LDSDLQPICLEHKRDWQNPSISTMPLIRPSSLPALAQCAKFEPGSSDFADSGTKRHAALKAHFDGDDALLDALPDDDRDGVKWAADYIRLKSPMSDHPISFERKGSFVTSDFDEIIGTLDCECGPTLFDLKWRERDYGPQMACYALMMLSGKAWPEITVHILFAERQRAETYRIDEQSALNIVEAIVSRAKDPAAKETPCDYCTMCARRLSCPALNKMALAVVNGREDWKLEQWHASEIQNPGQMLLALRAVPFIRKWCAAVEYHADEMWQQKGIQIPGCELKESKGKTYAADIQGAFNASGLPLEKFLKCATLRMKSSKDEPGKLGIVDAYVEENRGSFASKAAAERDLKKKIEPFVARGKSHYHVKPVNQIEEESETK